MNKKNLLIIGLLIVVVAFVFVFGNKGKETDAEKFKKEYEKKIDSSSSLFLNLKPTTKIIRQIKKINPDIFLVGFKAEFNISREEIIKCAKKQIADAGTDLVVANDISKDKCHFGSDNNEVLIVDREVLTIPLASKREIAKSIFDVISKKM